MNDRGLDRAEGRAPKRPAALDGASSTAGEAQLAGTCELCGGPVVERHCKIVCLNCGAQRDCSDP